MSERKRAAERRRVLRRHMSPIDTVFRTKRVYGMGRLKNITRQGVFVRARPLPEPADDVTVTFETAAGVKIELRGEVIWTTDQLPEDHPRRSLSGFGMRIHKVPDEFLEFFEFVLGS